MTVVRGTVVHCSRFGAIVRLQNGRLASVLLEEAGMATIRRAMIGGKRPEFPFAVEEDDGRHLRLALLAESAEQEAPERRIDRSASLEQKIIDYLRQTSEWDPRVSDEPREEERPRADRLLPFELRARRQYRDTPERPRRPKRR